MHLYAVVVHMTTIKTGDMSKVPLDRFVSLGAARNAVQALNAQPAPYGVMRAVRIEEVPICESNV